MILVQPELVPKIFNFVTRSAVRGSTSLFESNKFVALPFALEYSLRTEIIDRRRSRRLSLIEVSFFFDVVCCTLEVIWLALVTYAE